ncbi:Putative Spherulation-specific family 4 [Septoria linicola]|uniref:Spherulation-specific family 4 n=1 Tax=Septoria linicola TaxID=215465 RepID=A0A9Q9EKZ2_9PEZI|nr:putative Spherulation-specific family 4 [Septoria linicola]USW52878.1 Putative Spherulation-specific family 4 [Septoria linicola]
MAGKAFLLIPLYIYPAEMDHWKPIITAAQDHRDVTFRTIINPENGPGPNQRPNSDFVWGLSQLNAEPNIETLAYVHTANKLNCGRRHDGICVCSQPMQALQKNISIYQNWPTSGCSPDGSNTMDITVDGIFFDEAPSNASCYDYMSQAASYAKSTLTRGNIVLFNAGAAVPTLASQTT